MSLVNLFERSVRTETWAHFAALPDLQSVLERFAQAGQSAWPAVKLDADVFIAFVARHLPESVQSVADFFALRAADIYLVCAYGLGDRHAGEVIERQYFPKVQQALRRVNTSDAMIDDIGQELRRILIEMHDPAITRCGYSGRSELASWLCLCALRETALLQKREQRERSLEHAALELIPADGHDPEISTLIRHYHSEFEAAFAEAVQALTPHERNLLRFHCLHQMNVDQIALIYQVHRATAARRVSAARERVVTDTRRRFAQRILVHTGSLPRILELVQAQAGLSVGHILVKTPEPELASG